MPAPLAGALFGAQAETPISNFALIENGPCGRITGEGDVGAGHGPNAATKGGNPRSDCGAWGSLFDFAFPSDAAQGDIVVDRTRCGGKRTAPGAVPIKTDPTSVASAHSLMGPVRAAALCLVPLEGGRHESNRVIS